MTGHRHLKRLSNVWVPDAVYFITTCTHERRRILASNAAVDVVVDEWRAASSRHGWHIGRYVIMPDHVHFFCAEQPGGAVRQLSQFMNAWKTWTARRLSRVTSIDLPFWQRSFFDHVLRRDESYAEKWLYVRDNPVRAGLVAQWDEWPYQGWIDFDQPRGDVGPAAAPTGAATDCAVRDNATAAPTGAATVKPPL